MWGMCFLAQRLDDGHLGKVLHRLLELGQGPPAIAFASFDVLGLRFWGRICEIQEQSTLVTRFLQIQLPGHSTQGRFGCSVSSTKLAPLFPLGCHQLLLSRTTTLTTASGLMGWNWSCSKKTQKVVTKWNLGSIFLPLPQFPHQVRSVNKMGGKKKQPTQPYKCSLGWKTITSPLLALIFITSNGQV